MGVQVVSIKRDERLHGQRALGRAYAAPLAERAEVTRRARSAPR